MFYFILYKLPQKQSITKQNITLHTLKPNWVYTITMLRLARLRNNGAKLSFCEYIQIRPKQWAVFNHFKTTRLPLGSCAIIPNFQNREIMKISGETWL
jgi:hypothetical protein